MRQFVATAARPWLTWNDLPFLRGITKLPIVLKGIQHPDDARRVLDAGMDGGVVSNHGGRQVDGARVVLLGRTMAYGLAVAGERGVREVIRRVLAELDQTLGLAGQDSVRGLSPDVLAG